MTRYPFHSIAAAAITLGLCSGCNPSQLPDGESAPSVHDETTAVLAPSPTNDADTAQHALSIDSSITLTAIIGPLEAHQPSTSPNAFELNIDRVEADITFDNSTALPCHVEYLMIDDLGGVQPVELEWFRGVDATYELLIDVFEPEFKRHVGQIVQTSTGMAEVDLSETLAPNTDYAIDIEVLNVDLDQICFADGLIRFDPISE